MASKRAIAETDEAKLKRLGRRIKSARKEAKITQQALATKLRYQLRTIHKFETGEINIPALTLMKIRKALGCSWQDLLGD